MDIVVNMKATLFNCDAMQQLTFVVLLGLSITVHHHFYQQIHITVFLTPITHITSLTGAIYWCYVVE